MMMSPRLSNPDGGKVGSSSRNSPASSHLSVVDQWVDDGCMLDIDHFARSLAAIKAKGVRPDLVGSIISHYATKWLPDLSSHETKTTTTTTTSSGSSSSSTAAWTKKRFFLETLVGILPPEKDCLPCAFLLRLLRLATMLAADPPCLADLEARVASRLDQASLKDLMIPAFNHTCPTLLDVELVLRLVRRFVSLDDAAKTGAAIVKVAKLVDGYLAEAALDGNLRIDDFHALAAALPSHARASDDGLYRAMDTYLKAHPSTAKQERKMLFRLIDTRKLTSEAALHAAQNERLPVRAVIQVLFSEQSKLNRLTSEFSGSFSGSRSPNANSLSTTLELPGRCPSKREAIVQHQEMRKMRDEIARLQIKCHSLQTQMDALVEGRKKKKKGHFRWKSFLSFRNMDVLDRSEDDGESGIMRRTPPSIKDGKNSSRMGHAKATPPKWRNSTS